MLTSSFDLTIGNEGYKSRLRPQIGNIYYFACTSSRFLSLLLKIKIILLKTKILIHKIKTNHLKK